MALIRRSIMAPKEGFFFRERFFFFLREDLFRRFFFLREDFFFLREDLFFELHRLVLGLHVEG